MEIDDCNYGVGFESLRRQLVARKGLLGFGTPRREGDRQVFETAPYSTFKPRGLMLWNAAVGSTVSAIVIDRKLQVLCSHHPVPALWFAQAQSFEQIRKDIEEGKEPAAWGDFDTVNVGSSVRLTVENPASPVDVQAVMWGEYLV